MIGIRRVIRNPGWGGDPWDMNRELEPEAASELPGEDTIAISPTRASPEPISNGAEYQRNLVRAAIEQGGRLGDQEIPLYWLKTILAGLEGRVVEPGEAWGSIERPDPLESPNGPEPPSYYDLFPAEREPEHASF